MSITSSVNRTIAVSTWSYSREYALMPTNRLALQLVGELRAYLRPEGWIDGLVTPAELQACDDLIDWFMRGPGNTDVYPSFSIRSWSQPYGLVFIWGWSMDEYCATGAFRQVE